MSISLLILCADLLAFLAVVGLVALMMRWAGSFVDRLLASDERPRRDECDAQLKLASTTRYRR